MMEARCLVCGNPIGSDAWFGSVEDDSVEAEVCSEQCLEIYTQEE